MKQQEHLEQVALFNWATMRVALHPELDMLFAIPNGGHRHISVAKKLKAEGVKSGVPDVCLPVSRGGYHALYIEMKVRPNKPSDSQMSWIGKLHSEGNAVYVCYDWVDAAAIIEDYLRGNIKKVIKM